MPDTPEETRTLPALSRPAAPQLSVIVPVYNGGLQISRCLEALRLSEYRDFEVIVVDDCSVDNTPQIVQRYPVEYLRTPRTMGPGGARNLGVRQARGKIVVFVDSDVVVPAEALGLIAEEFNRDPKLAAVFGSYDEAPAWENFLSQYKNLMHHYVHQTSNERATTFWAGCGAIRKRVFEEFGGFNAEKYPYPSIEDIELGYRLTQAGRKIRLSKRLQVKHLKRWTLRGLLRADIFHRAIPWTNLILASRHLPRDLNLTYTSRVSAGLSGLLFLGAMIVPLVVAGRIQWIAPRVLWLGLATPAVLLLLLNRRVYAFFGQKRGWGFTARAVLVHWFYYVSSGIAFLLCGVVHLMRSFFATPHRQGAEAGIRPTEPQA